MIKFDQLQLIDKFIVYDRIVRNDMDIIAFFSCSYVCIHIVCQLLCSKCNMSLDCYGEISIFLVYSWYDFGLLLRMSISLVYSWLSSILYVVLDISPIFFCLTLFRCCNKREVVNKKVLRVPGIEQKVSILLFWYSISYLACPCLWSMESFYNYYKFIIKVVLCSFLFCSAFVWVIHNTCKSYRWIFSI